MPFLLAVPVAAALTPEMVAATVNLVGVLWMTYFASKMSSSKPSSTSNDAKQKA